MCFSVFESIRVLSHLPSYMPIPLICGWENENGGRFSNRESTWERRRPEGRVGTLLHWIAGLSNMARVSLVLEDNPLTFACLFVNALGPCSMPSVHTQIGWTTRWDFDSTHGEVPRRPWPACFLQLQCCKAKQCLHHPPPHVFLPTLTHHLPLPPSRYNIVHTVGKREKKKGKKKRTHLGLLRKYKNLDEQAGCSFASFSSVERLIK